MEYDNNDRIHQGKKCRGRTPTETLLDGKSIWAEKNLAQICTAKHWTKMGNIQIKPSHLKMVQNQPRHKSYAN